MSNKLEHVPSVIKHAGDASAGLSVLLTWVITLTPFLNFAIVLLALFWGYYRILDIKLSIELKKARLRRSDDIKD